MTPRKFIRKSFFLIARKLGFIAIPEWKLESYFHAIRLKRIISEYKIDCFFDVGANIGQFRDFLRIQVEYDGLIISFEPDPENFNKLNERQKTDKKWVVLDYAMGKEKKPHDFHIMKSSTFNSFLEPDSSECRKYEDKNSVIKTITIETKRVDEVIQDIKKKYEFENVFLKLDTQGFDLEVFEGASGCLNQIRGVQSEVSLMPIYKNMATFEASLKAFKSKGFEVSGLYSLSESRFPHAVEYNCIYLPK
jgi:FkbM family methyltransferase